MKLTFSKGKSLSREPLIIGVDDPVYPSLVIRQEYTEPSWKQLHYLLPIPSFISFRRSFYLAGFIVLCFSTWALCGFYFHVKQSQIERMKPLNAQLHPYYDQFIAYTQKYKKEYGSWKDKMDALDSYAKNSKDIEKWNDEHIEKGVEFGENSLSDYTDEEFKRTLLPIGSFKKRREQSTFIKKNPPALEQVKETPPTFDWRTKGMITPVKAQGKCGSCWAFASTATVEAAWRIAHNETRILSEQTLLDCDLDDNACDGGDEDKAFRFIHREGLAYSEEYPYHAARQNACTADSHNRTKIEVAYFLNPDENSMINWLVNFGPVNIGMSVIQPMRSYKGGVFHPSEYACKNEVIGLHAMLIVGYGTSDKGEKYWIIKNSWGQDFGVENGYIYFARGFNACFVEDEPVGILA